MRINNNDTVIFLGDSITDCGRHHPNGEGSFGSGAFGNGYPNFITALYKAMHPGNHVRFINKGIGGNQTRHVMERLERDVIDYSPQIVTLCIGINDVWRLYDEAAVGTGVQKQEYESNMRYIIEKIKASGAELLLMPPYIIDSNREEPMRKTMDEYGEVCAKLAVEYDLEYFDIQAMFDDLLSSGAYTYELSGDRIHPTQAGHAAIAINLLKCFGEM